MGILRLPNCEDIATKQIVVEKMSFRISPLTMDLFINQLHFSTKNWKHDFSRVFAEIWLPVYRDVQEKILCIHNIHRHSPKQVPLCHIVPSHFGAFPLQVAKQIQTLSLSWWNKKCQFFCPATNFLLIQISIFHWFIPIYQFIPISFLRSIPVFKVRNPAIRSANFPVQQSPKRQLKSGEGHPLNPGNIWVIHNPFTVYTVLNHSSKARVNHHHIYWWYKPSTHIWVAYDIALSNMFCFDSYREFSDR